jgi:hypothetical protein
MHYFKEFGTPTRQNTVASGGWQAARKAGRVSSEAKVLIEVKWAARITKAALNSTTF